MKKIRTTNHKVTAALLVAVMMLSVIFTAVFSGEVKANAASQAKSYSFNKDTDKYETDGFFTITGSSSSTNLATGYSYGLKMNSSSEIAFTPTASGTIEIVWSMNKTGLRLTINGNEIETDEKTAKTEITSKIAVKANTKYSIKRKSGELRVYSISYTPDYKVTVIDPANTYSPSNVFTVAEGNTIDYTASGKDNFDYWENSHGVKVSTDPSLKDFPVYYSDTYTAVYKKTGAKVVYYTPYGGVYRTYYKNDVFTEAPEVPTLYGYAPGNWDKDYATVKDLLKNATDSSEISVKPEYPTNDSSMKYEINIDATKFGKESVEKLSKVVNELVTASIDANKEKFAYWKDDKGNIVSYNPTYYFIANRKVTVTAVSTEEATDPEKKGVITQIEYDETSRTVIFEYTVPDDFTMNYVGVLGSTNEGILTNAVVNVDAKGVYQLGNSNCSGYKTFRYTLNIVGSETWYVKPVLIYSNADDVQQNPVYGNKITIK